MAKIPVAQQDGEISFTPGGIKPARTYPVVKGVIEVEDEDAFEVMQNLGASPTKASLAEATAAAEQAAYNEKIAEQTAIDNAQAVADAAAAGAKRAAAELKASSKTAPG